jgi:hypothetical protein
MSMFTARCIVVRCDVANCDSFAEVLCRDGALNSIPGWLEVFPFGGSADLSCRKFICKEHAKQFGFTGWETPAEIPLSQAMQDPRFQKPDTIAFMAGMVPAELGDAINHGRKALDAAISNSTAKQLPGEKT